MSSINRFFATTFTVLRQTWSGDSSSLVSQGTFLGYIQQATSDNLQEFQGLRFGKTFKIWCLPDTDVEEGDRITQGNNTYDVRFVIDRNFGGNPHLEIFVEKSKE